MNGTKIGMRHVATRGREVHPDPARPGPWVAFPGGLPVFWDPEAL